MGPVERMVRPHQFGLGQNILDAVRNARVELVVLVSPLLLPACEAAHAGPWGTWTHRGPRRQTDCAAQHAGAKRQPRTDLPALDVRRTLPGFLILKL